MAHVERHRVDHFIRVRTTNFQMQMRSARRAGVTTTGNDIPFTDAEKRAVREEIDRKTLLAVLLLTDVAGQRRGKRIQMTVDRRIATGVRDVERVSIARGADRDA